MRFGKIVEDLVPHAQNNYIVPLPIMWPTEPRTGVTYYGWSSISSKLMLVMASILGAILEHTPFNIRYMMKTSNHIRHIYLRTCGGDYALKVAIAE